MLSSKPCLDDFLRDASTIGRVFAASDLFSLLSRQLTVPPTCVGLVWGEAAQPHVVPGGRAIESAGLREVLLVKTLPVWLDYRFAALRTRDDHDCAAALRLAVQAVPDRDELAAFRHSIVGSSNRCDPESLRAFLEESIRSATGQFVRAHDAAALLSPAISAEFDAALVEQFKPVGFESGLSLGRDPRVTFSSLSYAAAQQAAETQAQRARRLREEEALRAAAHEGRRQQLADIAGVVREARELAAAAPGVAIGDIIRRVDATKRGELYRGLMAPAGSTAATRAVLVVAGQELIRLDPAAPSKPPRRQALSADAGPLRSVRVTRDGLQQLILAGARRGVHLLDADEGPRRTYTFEPGRELRGGVNAAALFRDRLYATHSEMGLLAWSLIKADAAEACLGEYMRGAKSVRDVRVDAEHLWLAVDNKAIGWALPLTAPAPVPPPPIILTAHANIQCLEIADGTIYAGLEDGGIARAEISGGGSMEMIRPGGSASAVHSLVWLPGGGVPRLLVADRRPHLSLIVLGEAYQAEYRWKEPLRWAAAAGDLIAGVSDARDHVILWRPEEPEEPIAAVSIGRFCGQPVQDLCMLPASASLPDPSRATAL